MKTIYGTGVVQSIRSDGIHVVTVQSWKLANNTSPTLYVQADALTKEVLIFLRSYLILVRLIQQFVQLVIWFELHMEKDE